MVYKQFLNPLTNVLLPGIKRINANGTESFIPNEPENRDWKEYLAWLDEGNTPLPADK